MARAKNAAKQAASRSQRTTKRRYFFWNQAKVRSAWNRGDVLLDGPAPRFLRLPDAFGDLRPNAAAAELLAQGFRIVAFIRREDFGAFPRASTVAGPQMDRIQQRE